MYLLAFDTTNYYNKWLSCVWAKRNTINVYNKLISTIHFNVIYNKGKYFVFYWFLLQSFLFSLDLIINISITIVLSNNLNFKFELTKRLIRSTNKPVPDFKIRFMFTGNSFFVFYFLFNSLFILLFFPIKMKAIFLWFEN